MRVQDEKVAPGPRLGPVMTFRIAGEWVAVRVAQMDRVAVAAKLWPVPWTVPGYLGLFDSGQELVPVLQLTGGAAKPESGEREHLVAILHVRGESVGVVIDRAGHLCEAYDLQAADLPSPAPLRPFGGRRAQSTTESFWLVDTDQLWPYTPPA